MVRLVDRYIGRAAVLGILGVWIALTMLFVVYNLLDELRETQANYGTVDALWFVALTIPKTAYEVFPMAALLGALVGVGGLAAANELVAFRTSGASRLRLAVAALGGTLVMTLLVMIMGEWVAPAAEQQARAFRLGQMVNTAVVGGPRGMWMRDGNAMVNIQRPVLSADLGVQSIAFQNVVIYHFGEDGLEQVTRAGSASHDGSEWTLQGVNRVRLSEDGAETSWTAEETWSTSVRPDLLDAAVSRPRSLSIRSLWEFMGYMEQNELDDRVYRTAFFDRVLYPFTVIALVLAGMPFVFAQARSQSVGARLFFGMTVGGLFMIVNHTFLKLTGVYDLPPLLVMSLPIALLMAGALLALRRSV